MDSLRSAIGASPAARRVTVDGVGLAVDDHGRGPAIVCLHAIGHGAADFAALDQFAAANGLLADVPEPASLGLAIIGSAGLLARRRKRRNA